MCTFFCLVRSRQILDHVDHSEYEYHDNESSNFNLINDSKTYPDEMKVYIERLLSTEGSNVLQAKLNAYIQDQLTDAKNVAVNDNQEIDMNRVNVVEISQDGVTTGGGRVYNDEM